MYSDIIRPPNISPRLSLTNVSTFWADVVTAYISPRDSWLVIRFMSFTIQHDLLQVRPQDLHFIFVSIQDILNTVYKILQRRN